MLSRAARLRAAPCLREQPFLELGQVCAEVGHGLHRVVLGVDAGMEVGGDLGEGERADRGPEGFREAEGLVLVRLSP